MKLDGGWVKLTVIESLLVKSTGVQAKASSARGFSFHSSSTDEGIVEEQGAGWE